MWDDACVGAWDTAGAIAGIVGAVIGLGGLCLTLTANRTQKGQDRKHIERESVIQPSLVYCNLELERPDSEGKGSAVLEVSNTSNQLITKVDADLGIGNSPVQWDQIGPGKKVRHTIGPADETALVNYRSRCKVEFNGVDGTRWKRTAKGNIQRFMGDPSEGGQGWSDPIMPVVMPVPLAARSSFSPLRIIIFIAILIASGILIYYSLQH